MAETLRTMRAAYNAATDPVEGLVRALVGSIGPDPEPEEFANHLAFLHLELADPEFRAILADYDAAVQNELATYLAEAVDKGQLAVNDVEDLASTLNALRHGTQVAWAIARDGSLADAARRHIETLLAPYRRARSSARGNTTKENSIDGTPP
ncbi:MAG TPA: TetR family transcriptional regulator C-terminal domain-containing protein [Chloroflexota bacterium]